jgi:urease accessory protein
VISAATVTERETFAANRAYGRLALAVEAVGGVSRRTNTREEGSLRVRFPGPSAPALQAVVVNTAGGMAGGDRFELDFDVGANADLTVSTVAAEKVYRSDGPDSVVDINFNVATSGSLSWLPQETILFDRARLRRRIEVKLAADASLLLAEAIIFGRSAMGESVKEGRFIDRWRVRQNGKLLFAETVHFDGPIMEMLAEPAIAAGNIALATVLVVPGDSAKIEAIRTRSSEFLGEVGSSAWGGIGLVRLCARDGVTLRHDLTVVLSALGQVVLPRLWSN